MVSKNKGIGDIPLKLAAELSKIVNGEWESGQMADKVTPVTADLLRFWFDDVFITERTKNFHMGQRQAILNAIFCHEVIQAESLLDIYSFVDSKLLPDIQKDIQKDRYAHPQYAIKMATGTGKTWVLNALLIWQYLNAKFSGGESPVKFTKNFLSMAPGLIVYERLLDAFKGKQQPNGFRDFDTSDFKINEELFIPEKYRQSLYSFIQNSVMEKTDIGRKITGEGLIAITNWHTFMDKKEDEGTRDKKLIETANMSFCDTKNIKKIAKDLLPLSPGVGDGHGLDELDKKYFYGGELEYLISIPDICVFNDEAHHIHENIKEGMTTDVEWQKALDKISNGKGRNFIQIDFSATPYSVAGGANQRTKNFFPHIIVDFDLTTAMRAGLVKSFVIDKRKAVADLENSEIEFKAIRDGTGKVIALSEGQRIMLSAGLTKLRILEEDFDKPPKMLVVCEDTDVSPLVVGFLKNKELDERDIIQIDSGIKGEISEKEWAVVKQKLFNIDKSKQPKVIVSVLMLREGFDVNNVCVIVPLRSTKAPILLEQVLGRGLRLMWREPEYDDIKAENRQNLYNLHKPPEPMYDILFVVEHPAFMAFYEDLDKDLVRNCKKITYPFTPPSAYNSTPHVHPT
ncbi:hypothetical protein FACS1894152_5850 [Bacilli bacterium]|nr:hypothetical protein FACS1894152_5850 [Bacilli bacterium]